MDTDVSDNVHKRAFYDEDQADTSKKARLDPDDLQISPKNHVILKDTLSHLSINPPLALYTLLSLIHGWSGGSSWRTFQDPAEANEFLDEHPRLIKHIKDNTLNALLAEECLRIRTIPEDGKQVINSDVQGTNATLISWTTPFKGSPDPLLITIRQYMQLPDQGVDNLYARCAAFTQSSGTGKSRMNDELAKRIVCIPVGLATTPGAFPPSDRMAIHYFQSQLNQASKESQMISASCFMHALFVTAHNRLELIAKEVANVQEGDKLQEVASRFREKMSQGISFTGHGTYRVEFFKEVHQKATANLGSAMVKSRSNESHSPSRSIHGPMTNLRESATQLVKLLSFDGPTPSDQPLVIVCFDEAHTLTDVHEGTSFFFELRRALRTIRAEPIFTLFLSTTGSLEQLSPPPYADASERVGKLHLQMCPPICLTPLDVLAEKFNPRGGWQLSTVASTRHIVHLGRPLFASRYDAGDLEVRENIFDFALTKLFCTHDRDVSKLAQGKQEPLLACLGVRIPFDFKRLDYSLERRLVSHHMRLLLYAEPGFTSLVTASASEPVLAEAAYKFFCRRRWIDGNFSYNKEHTAVQPYHLLDRAFTQTDVDLGTRGEILAATLLMDARDRATTYNSKRVTRADADVAAKRRIISVEQFLKALLGDENFNRVAKFNPTVVRTSSDSKKSLKDAFKHANIYFTHFIKAHSFEVINQEYLLLAISRGAAIICADNFGGIDIIIPTLIGSVLKKEMVSAILVQVKNSRQFTTTIKRSLFTAMNPYTCGLFDAEVTEPNPVLRTVLALASERSVVETLPAATCHSSRIARTEKFTAYDVWCAGALCTTFGVINKQEEGILGALLVNMRDSRDVVRKTDEALLPTLRQMQPCSSTYQDHYKNWVDTGDVGEELKTVTLVDEESFVDVAEELEESEAADA
ncbi:hypothetical protein C8Q80DRAFT_1178933 [Daedaleopsis nitida]|nr:hypothetical protein C8Q80DRAFT_1178933 [Daedaleopsis nitida]